MCWWSSVPPKAEKKRWRRGHPRPCGLEHSRRVANLLQKFSSAIHLTSLWIQNHTHGQCGLGGFASSFAPDFDLLSVGTTTLNLASPTPSGLSSIKKITMRKLALYAVTSMLLSAACVAVPTASAQTYSPHTNTSYVVAPAFGGIQYTSSRMPSFRKPLRFRMPFPCSIMSGWPQR